MKTPKEILETCGSDEAIAAALGVSKNRVERSKRDQNLPAAWFDGLEQLAQKPLPREVFSFKRAENSAA